MMSFENNCDERVQTPSSKQENEISPNDQDNETTIMMKEGKDNINIGKNTMIILLGIVHVYDQYLRPVLDFVVNRIYDMFLNGEEDLSWWWEQHIRDNIRFQKLLKNCIYFYRKILLEDDIFDSQEEEDGDDEIDAAKFIDHVDFVDHVRYEVIELDW